MTDIVLAVGQRMIFHWPRGAEDTITRDGAIVRLTPRFVFVRHALGNSHRLNRLALETWGKFTQAYGWTWFTEATFTKETAP